MALAEALSMCVGRYSRASGSDASKTPLIDAPKPTPEQLKLFAAPFVELMNSTKCYDVMGNSSQIVVIESAAALSVAFVAAQESRATTCVLWDSAAKSFEGTISISDYIHVLLHCHRHPDESDTVPTLTVQKWMSRPESSPSCYGPNFVRATLDDKVLDCALKMVKGSVSKVPVFSVREAAGTPSVVGLIKYSHFLAYLARMVGASAVPAMVPSAAPSSELSFSSLLDIPISLLDISPNQRNTVSATMETRIVDALGVFLSANVQTLGIVDDKRIVIDTLSRADVLRLESGGLFEVTKTLAEALSLRVTNRIVVCTAADTFRQVLQHFVTSGVNEIFVVDEKDRLVGQVSLADLLRFLLQCADLVA